MSSISQEDLILVLGKTHDSAEGQAILSALGLEKSPLNNPYGTEIGCRTITSLDSGVNIGLEDIGVIEDIPYHDVGEGPWVITEIWLRSGITHGGAYQGSLPHSISFEMRQDDVRELLGAPDISGVADVWKMGLYRLAVNYNPATRKITSVGLQMSRDKP